MIIGTLQSAAEFWDCQAVEGFDGPNGFSAVFDRDQLLSAMQAPMPGPVSPMGFSPAADPRLSGLSDTAPGTGGRPVVTSTSSEWSRGIMASHDAPYGPKRPTMHDMPPHLRLPQQLPIYGGPQYGGRYVPQSAPHIPARSHHYPPPNYAHNPTQFMPPQQQHVAQHYPPPHAFNQGGNAPHAVQSQSVQQQHVASTPQTHMAGHQPHPHLTYLQPRGGPHHQQWNGRDWNG